MAAFWYNILIFFFPFSDTVGEGGATLKVNTVYLWGPFFWAWCWMTPRTVSNVSHTDKLHYHLLYSVHCYNTIFARPTAMDFSYLLITKWFFSNKIFNSALVYPCPVWRTLSPDFAVDVRSAGKFLLGVRAQRDYIGREPYSFAVVLTDSPPLPQPSPSLPSLLGFPSLCLAGKACLCKLTDKGDWSQYQRELYTSHVFLYWNRIHERINLLRFLGINFDTSQTWGFCMDFLNYKEGGMVFCQVFLLSPLQCTVAEL
jgi:hypothetical protein